MSWFNCKCPEIIEVGVDEKRPVKTLIEWLTETQDIFNKYLLSKFEKNTPLKIYVERHWAPFIQTAKDDWDIKIVISYNADYIYLKALSNPCFFDEKFLTQRVDRYNNETWEDIVVGNITVKEFKGDISLVADKYVPLISKAIKQMDEQHLLLERKERGDLISEAKKLGMLLEKQNVKTD